MPTGIDWGGMPAMISPSHTSKGCAHLCVWGMDNVGKGGLGRKSYVNVK